MRCHSSAKWAFVRGLLGIAAIAVSAPLLAASGSWSSNGPFGGSVRKVIAWEYSPGTLWAGGNGGVFRSTSSGASWQRVEIGLPGGALMQDLVASTTSTPVLFETDSKRIYRSGNGGDLWVPVSALPSASYIISLSLRRTTTDQLAALTDVGVFVSSNGGSTWSGPTATGTTAQFTMIDYAADGSLYLGLYSDPGVFGGASVLKSSDGGASWTPLSTPAGLSATVLVSAPTNAQHLFVADYNSIATTSDGGATWSTLAAPPAGSGCGRISTLAADPLQPNALYVGCYVNGVHFSANVFTASPAWTDWTPANGLSVNGPLPVQAASIAVDAGTPALYVGAIDGGLFQSTNAGNTWSAINQGYQSSNIRALAVHPVDTTNPVVLAGQGDSFTTARAIYKSPDGGGVWTTATSGLDTDQVRTLAIDPTTVDANTLTSESFTVYAGGRAVNWQCCESTRNGGVYKSVNAGATWTTIDSGIAILPSATKPNMGTVRTVALDPRSCASPPASGPCLMGSGPLQTVYVAGGGIPGPVGMPYRSARIYKSTNAGATWSPSENGLPLPQDLGPPGASNSAFMGGVAPLVIDPVNPQTLYIGTFIGWDQTVAGAANPTIANSVFKSTDGGANWTLRSVGLPTYAGPGTSQQDVLALAINPTNPLVLYAGVTNFSGASVSGHVYKSTDGAMTWNEASTGIAGQDVRALFIDPADATGDTIYAGTGGDGANPGGVYRSVDGGATWNSLSIGLPAYASTALAMPPRAVGAPARILAGTNSGVWDYTAVPDGDADGAPTAVENAVMGGDGDGDGVPDAQESSVASLGAPSINGVSRTDAPTATGASTTISIVPTPSACDRLNDSNNLDAGLYPPDPLGDANSHAPGLVQFALPACAVATVRVIFHGATFGPGWVWRNYGPKIPGNSTSFGWYTFAGARRIDAQTWELDIDASRQGNYRADPNNILFTGGPALLPDVIFGNTFE